jgi:cobalt-zinc-cadmium efflux system protein
MRVSGRLLLDIVPDHLSTEDVTATLTALDEVVDAHHVHLWEPTLGEPAVSAHLVVDGDISVHESQALLDRVRSSLQEEHGVGHATFEVECHPCEEAEHGAATVAAEEGE